jgi:uncharacterized protein DUF6703
MRPENGNPLSKVPPLAVFIMVAAVFAAGVLIGGAAGMVLLGLLAVLVAVLLAASWPRLRPSERALRVLVLLTVIAVAISIVR